MWTGCSPWGWTSGLRSSLSRGKLTTRRWRRGLRHIEFLSVIGGEVTGAAYPSSERMSSVKGFSEGGYYSVNLPAPVRNARLLVLNDLFMSSKYATCAGKADTTEAAEQLAWLERQLASARANKEKVWVMGHIPPGIDVHARVT